MLQIAWNLRQTIFGVKKLISLLSEPHRLSQIRVHIHVLIDH